MSADLFAEFSNSTPPGAQPDDGLGPSSRQKKPASHNAFNSTAASAVEAVPVESQNPSLWSSLQSLSNNTNGWDQPSENPQSSNTGHWQEDADDGWGEFEVAEQDAVSSVPSGANVQTGSFRPETDRDVWSFHSVGPERTHQLQNVAQRPAFGVNEASLVRLEQSSAPDPTRLTNLQSDLSIGSVKHARPSPQDPNVLFDADDFELQDSGEYDDEVDEFGDFEAVETELKPNIATPANVSIAARSLDLLGLDDSPPPESNAIVPKTIGATAAPKGFGATRSSNPRPAPHSSQEQAISFRSTAPSLVKSSKASTHREEQTASSSPRKAALHSEFKIRADAPAEDDEWEAWDDLSSEIKVRKPAAKSRMSPMAAVDSDPWDEDTFVTKPSASAETADTSPPPTNIPPPAILLSAFPDFLRSAKALLMPLQGQDASAKEQLLCRPKTVDFLRGYLMLASTAGRIMAGRKHRWHRDKILANSMSISAAGSKGMKLAGVDKMQSVREDREAADVVLAWKEHVGRLRSAVAVVNSAGKAALKVPELSQHPRIQTARMVPTAPKACIICGLKRDERVDKVDYDVEDSFGEWWVEHWGHRACKNFWTQHEQRLRQR